MTEYDRNSRKISPSYTGKVIHDNSFTLSDAWRIRDMAAINDLIRQIEDKNLRDRLQQEVARLSKQKKFGLE